MRVPAVFTSALLLASSLAPGQTPAPVQNPNSSNAATPAPVLPPRFTIRILNAQTGRPVGNERLNVALTADQIGYRVLPTDKLGRILVDGTNATTVRVLSNFYADCRPRAELYTNYPLPDIWHSGITAGNLCSATHPAPNPGELLLYVIPKNAIRQMGQPPASNLPHSDENPNAIPDNPQPAPR